MQFEKMDRCFLKLLNNFADKSAIMETADTAASLKTISAFVMLNEMSDISNIILQNCREIMESGKAVSSADIFALLKLYMLIRCEVSKAEIRETEFRNYDLAEESMSDREECHDKSEVANAVVNDPETIDIPLDDDDDLFPDEDDIALSEEECDEIDDEFTFQEKKIIFLRLIETHQFICGHNARMGHDAESEEIISNELGHILQMNEKGIIGEDSLKIIKIEFMERLKSISDDDIRARITKIVYSSYSSSFEDPNDGIALLKRFWNNGIKKLEEECESEYEKPGWVQK